ncbi:hypothetical protein ACS3QZ_05985 [Shimia sp. W99]
MVTNNKVLTVSYGTFSCTLEGFEDSFDTMKAIAEYFRDLAADDRYFGAEPPTPDAEMLARIAEREIERRVQARVDHGAIVLSAAAAAAPAAAESTVATPAEDAKAPAPEQDFSEDAVEVTEGAEAVEAIESDDTDQAVVAALTEEAAPAPQPEEIEAAAELPETDEGADTDEDTVAAVMSQAEEEVSEPDTLDAEEPATPIIEATDSEEIEDALEMATPAETAEALAEAEDIVEEELAEIVDEAETLEDETFAEADEGTAPVVAEEEADAEDAFADWDDEEEDVDPEYEVNSIAAKLERIRAVVSRVVEEPEDDFSEDEHAEDVPAEDTFLADTVHQVEEALAAEDQPEDTPQPLRARVVRMKRADFEEAVASGLLEAEPVEEDEDEDMSLEDGTSLSPEDEAELLAELAEVEAELDVLASYEDDDDEPVSEERAESENSADAEDEAQDSDEPFVLTDAVETPDEDPAPKASEQLGEAAGGGDDLSRLMAKAESEMQEPVGKGRRQAIAHLRAAVKATKAEKEAGNDLSRRDHSEAYRDDLASVVRAVPGGASADKPRERSEAPLKLVAAQRVDAPAPAPERDPAPEVAEAAKAAEPTPDTAPRAPVRPRRVSAERIDREEIARNAAPVGTSAKVQGDFQAYATSVGATRLPEVLEAAAAYLTFVEGHDRFSRPMLMRMARDANEDEFSREIGLRSFGQLLREKKIEKIAGGRFTAKSTIGFKPDDRAVG